MHDPRRLSQLDPYYKPLPRYPAARGVAARAGTLGAAPPPYHRFTVTVVRPAGVASMAQVRVLRPDTAAVPNLNPSGSFVHDVPWGTELPRWAWTVRWQHGKPQIVMTQMFQVLAGGRLELANVQPGQPIPSKWLKVTDHGAQNARLRYTDTSTVGAFLDDYVPRAEEQVETNTPVNGSGRGDAYFRIWPTDPSAIAPYPGAEKYCADYGGIKYFFATGSTSYSVRCNRGNEPGTERLCNIAAEVEPTCSDMGAAPGTSKPGDACSLNGGGNGVYDVNMACVRSSAPGDACGTASGQPGVFDARMQCQPLASLLINPALLRLTPTGATNANLIQVRLAAGSGTGTGSSSGTTEPAKTETSWLKRWGLWVAVGVGVVAVGVGGKIAYDKMRAR